MDNLREDWPVIFALGSRKIDLDKGTSIHNLQKERGRDMVNPVIFPGWRRINKSVNCLERERTQQRVEMIAIGTAAQGYKHPPKKSGCCPNEHSRR